MKLEQQFTSGLKKVSHRYFQWRESNDASLCHLQTSATEEDRVPTGKQVPIHCLPSQLPWES